MPDLQQRIYDKLPFLGQNVAVSAYGLAIKLRRYGGDYKRDARHLMDSQWFSKEEMQELQSRKLQEIVTWAYEQVPYQKKRFDEAGINPYKVESIADLASIPVMTSKDLRNLGKQLVARDIKGKIYMTFSSGTTGSPTCTYVSAEDLRRLYPFHARARSWAGLPFGRYRACTFGVRMVSPRRQQTPPFWRYDVFANNYHFSVYHMSEKNLRAYCEKLAAINPVGMRSFPSALYVICRFLERHPNVPRPHPKAIITSAETLYDHHRAIIEEQMGCRIYDEYGSNELGAYATECERGSMHVHPELGMIQIEPVHTGEETLGFGNLICTSLINRTMPLIRYRMSDLIEFGQPCSCGRQMQVLSRIIGREEDLILTPEGNYVARLDPVFKHAKGVIEAQVIQDTIDSIRVRFVQSFEEPTEVTISTLDKELRDKLGDSMKFTYETVDKIERTSGGKFRAVISKVKKFESLEG